MKRKYRGRNSNKMGKTCITIMVLVMLGVMSVQIVNLYQKDQQYVLQEANLEKQKQEELERQEELEEYEAYTQTQEYIEDIAKSKLGLVYKNEIVFKEE